jgi:nitroreductase
MKTLPDTVLQLPTACAVDTTMRSRRSIRAFLPTAVSRREIEDILEVARYAPSGTNIQPWKVHVLASTEKDELCRRVLAAFDAPDTSDSDASEEYAYYPAKWRSPYIDRRREVGYALYSLLGIEKGDKEKMHRQHGRNYVFFGAPVGLIFTIDRDLGQGSWLDYGMFLQNVMLAARARGLDTCPQAAFNKYHDVIARTLALPETEMIVCAMALGHRDPGAIENRLLPSRCNVEEFSRFLGFD